jgi:hypothetical protein
VANIADAQNSFEAGEIDVIALARADIEAYARAVTSAVNFDLLPQGPARKRFGGRVYPLSPSLDTAILIGGSQNAQPILIAIQTDSTIRTLRANNANYGDLIQVSSSRSPRRTGLPSRRRPTAARGSTPCPDRAAMP